MLGLERETAPEQAPHVEPDSLLNRREREVAALVADGLTDREISTRLVISQRTAESDMQHILGKLSFRSRAQIAAWVTQQNQNRPPDR